jgi:hypothetical protein
MPTNSYEINPLDREGFSSFETCPFKHNFHQHPAMEFDHLKRLADFLDKKDKCRFADPNLTVASPFDHHSKHPAGKSVAEVFEELNDPSLWVGLYNVEMHPEYRAFLDDVIESGRHFIEKEQGKILDATGFIFIAAPPS